MELSICDQSKKDKFVGLFHMLKNCTNILSATFKTNEIHIQGIDKSHICLFDTHILNTWFDSYKLIEEFSISFDTNIFYTILNSNQNSSDIIVKTDDSDSDSLLVQLITKEYTKGEFNKYFKIPLCDYDYNFMDIPSVEYDAEFTINSKKINEIFSQMIIFGNDINIKCSEVKIDLITNGVTGEMLVNIPIDDLNEFSILEGEEIDLDYSIVYINKMCLANKITSEVTFSISNNYPMKINYDLGNNSFINFFIAPKIKDND
jgi:proliferating cell nuclear antigen